MEYRSSMEVMRKKSMVLKLSKLARLIAAREYLLGPREVEMRFEYMSKIGQYELGALRLSCDAERLRRKYELAQEALRQGDLLDEEAIEEQLNEEFAVKDELVEEMASNLMLMVGYQQMPHPSREETSEMLEILQELAKKCYPGLYPNDGEKQAQWEEITELFRMSDIEALLQKEQDAEVWEGFSEMKDELDEEKLEHLQMVVQEEVDAILQRFPYNLKELLEDEEQLAGRRRELEETAEQAEAEIRSLYRELGMILEPMSTHLN